jgi:hypothetical protein
MSLLRSARAAVLIAATIAVPACDSFEVEEIQVALLSVPTQEGDEGYLTSPSAVFIQGTGIGLSSSQVGQEGCVDRDFTGSGGTLNFEYLDAGASVVARFDGPQVTMPRSTAEGRITYDTPEGLELPFTPGQTITFDIPGAAGGFPRRLAAARTAEEFTAAAITLPTNTTDNLTVTWTGIPEVPGSAMFYSIKYSSSGSTSLDREIACVFRDDGSGIVAAALLEQFRQSSVRQATAQRGRITTNRSGPVITHVTSTFSVNVLLTDVP